MKGTFHPRYLAGEVQRINADATVSALLDLGFNVHVQVKLTVEGLTFRGLTKPTYDMAMHCLLVLLGGKDFFALTPYIEGNTALARVFLAARVRDPHAPGLTTLDGVSQPVLEVATFMAYIAQNRYDVGLVKRALNGSP